MKNDLGLEAMAHLTCVGATVDELRAVLDELRAGGIENVIALRGDPPQGETEWKPVAGGLSYANELSRSSRENYDFCVVGACYPEVHQDAPICRRDLATSSARSTPVRAS